MEKLILKSVERNLENKLQDLRISKQIPAIVYGKKFPSKPIAVSYSDFLKTFRVGGYTHIIQLVINDKKVDVIIQNIQNHPITGNFQHIDFLAIDAKEKVYVKIPIILTGFSIATKEGGLLDAIIDEIEVKCLPSDLLDKFEFDISVLEKIGDVAHVKDLNIDTKKYEISIPLDSPIVSILDGKVKEEIPVEAPKVEEVGISGKEEKEGEGKEGEGKEGGDKKEEKK